MTFVWAVVSDEPADIHTFDEYGLRFDQEENFLDDKSAGFQIESSEIRTIRRPIFYLGEFRYFL